MAKLVKVLLLGIAAVVGIVFVAAIAVALFFDPNDYREQVEQVTYEATGRQLSIEGDIGLTVFPWLAIEVGPTTLGNGAGFGDEPMLRFEQASLSVEMLPLLLERRVRVGTASLEGLVANLAVLPDGRSNSEDIGAAGGATATEDSATDGATVEVDAEFALAIENIVLSDARVVYDDASSGSRYELNEVNIGSSAVALGEPFDIDGAFDLVAEPSGLAGTVAIGGAILISEDLARVDIADLAIRSTLEGLLDRPADIRFDSRAIALDTNAQTVALGDIDLQALGMAISASVEPLSYAGDPTVAAQVRVADFSLKELLSQLDIEAPETADPNALTTVSFEAAANAGAERLTLSDMRLVLDDTTLSGSLSVPFTDAGRLEFDLQGDSITVDNYMAPPSEAEVTAEPETDVAIPAELVRTLNARGQLRFNEAFVGPVQFTAMQVAVESAGGRLRLHPIAAEFFDGNYSGDVRIDATGDTPRLSVNETINNVNIAAMLAALYDVENVTGTVNAGFELAGAGGTLSSLTSDLDGALRFDLSDGEWQGVDVWHQIRSARALFKREPAPAARTPARTEFTSITLSGPVADGVFQSDDLLAQLPFLRITGGGAVNLAERSIDYSVQARVLENPEFASVASEDELNDFTQALIPIRISGSLAEPSFRPDIEGIFRQEVERAIDEKKEELKEDLLNRLLGGDDADAETGDGEAPEEDPDLEDQLKDRLRDFLPR